MKKRVIALLVAIVMLVAMLPLGQMLVSAAGTTTFDELVGSDIEKGLISRKFTLDTAEEFKTMFPSYDTTGGVLTLPADAGEIGMNNKTDGFPVGSVLHFKVDGFIGTNSNKTDKPAVVLYWLDSKSPKVGYYLMLKFNDVNGKPALHYNGTSIQSADIDTAKPFEVLAKRTAKEEIEIYARQSEGADAGYIKLATGAPIKLAHMDQLAVKAGNGQGIKFDYIKVYRNHEAEIVEALKSYMAAKNYNNVKYYKKHCGITDATWADFDKLTNKDAVYGIDTSSITTADAFGKAFTQAVAAQKEAEENTNPPAPGPDPEPEPEPEPEPDEGKNFDQLVGNGISKGLIARKVTLDTAEEFATLGGFNASTMPTTNGVLTTPATDGELTLSNKTDGFPVGSAMHFKIDGFAGTNNNTKDKPGVKMYWLDSTAPKVGYYFMLKFKDVNGKPALHYSSKSIQSDAIDTAKPFEVLVKRTATAELEIYAKQSENADAEYIKLATEAPVAVTHMNQIVIMTGNGQNMKLDYLKFYQNNEASIVSAVKASLNADGHKTLEYYKTACGITSGTWADFLSLTDKTPVYGIDTSSITTAESFGAAFTQAVAAQKEAEGGGSNPPAPGPDPEPEPEPDGTKTFESLIGSALTNEEAVVDFNIDSAEDFENLTYFDGTKMTTTDGILTLPPTDAETTVTKTVTNFPVGSVLHYKISGFAGTNNKNNTSKPATVFYFPADSGIYYFMLPFNDVGGKPSLRGSTASGWKGLTDGIIDTTKPFEVMAIRKGTALVSAGSDIDIWARQNSDDEFIKLGTVGSNSAPDQSKGSMWLKSGNNQSISYDFVKTYIPTDKGKLITSDVTVSEPENNELTVSGTIKVGYTAENFTSSATVYAVVYNKEHGYVTAIDKYDIKLTKGETTNISHTFDVSGVDFEKEDVAILVWDAYGRALATPCGYSPKNNSTEQAALGTPAGMNVTTKYNNVNITGFVGKKVVETVTIIVKDADGNIKAMAQLNTNEFGVLDTTIGIDPYVNIPDGIDGGNHTVTIKVGNAAATQTVVELLNHESFASYDITDSAKFKAFIQQFGTEDEKLAVAEDDVADAAYTRFVELVGEGSTSDFLVLSKLAPLALKTEIDDRSFISQFNDAVTYERWTIMHKLITDTFSDHLEITEADKVSADSVSSQKDLYLRIPKNAYASSADILTAFKKALADQIAADLAADDAPPSYSGGGGGGGGGGGSYVSVKEDTAKTDTETSDVPNEQPAEADFVDIENVSWAKDSINELKKLRILSGDGNGYFYPNRTISREEFLKLVLEALEITSNNGNEPQFNDVNKDAWYYSYIKTAYQYGIVTGMSADHFGIGAKITRADMATIVVRALSIKETEMKLINNAIVFDDVWDIPKYARESVNTLYRAALINGKAEGVFAPLDNTTRAEAAVLIHRILNYSAAIQ